MATQRDIMMGGIFVDGLLVAAPYKDILSTDDLPSLAAVAVTSFNTRVGDVTFVATDLPTSGVSPGTIDLPTVTVDQYGRVTSIIASPTVLVHSVTSTGSTLTVTGTTTSNVELNLGHANAWTAAQTYTAGGKTLSFGGSTTTITSSDTELIIEQTGDTLGTCHLKLRNRSGLNGALFENVTQKLVDFGFLTSDAKQGNQRFENRTGSNNYAGTPEFQFIVDGTAGTVTPTFCIAVSGSNGVVGLNNRDGDYGCYLRWLNYTTVATTRTVAEFINSWATKTDATRKGRLVCNVYDTAAREALRMEADGARAWAGVPAGNSTSFAKLGGAVFDHFADSGNTHSDGTFDDLVSDTTPAAILATNGDKISGWYAGQFVSSATATREIKVAFAGTTIFDTGALTLSLSSSWVCYVEIIRVSATVIRYAITLATEGAALAAYTAAGELTGLTLSGTNILKLTAAAAGVGAAANDILLQASSVSWTNAA